jgi:hypothetical protein
MDASKAQGTVLLYCDKSTAGGATTDSIAKTASKCIHLVNVITNIMADL